MANVGSKSPCAFFLAASVDYKSSSAASCEDSQENTRINAHLTTIAFSRPIAFPPLRARLRAAKRRQQAPLASLAGLAAHPHPPRQQRQQRSGHQTSAAKALARFSSRPPSIINRRRPRVARIAKRGLVGRPLHLETPSLVPTLFHLSTQGCARQRGGNKPRALRSRAWLRTRTRHGNSASKEAATKRRQQSHSEADDNCLYPRLSLMWVHRGSLGSRTLRHP